MFVSLCLSFSVSTRGIKRTWENKIWRRDGMNVVQTNLCILCTVNNHTFVFKETAGCEIVNALFMNIQMFFLRFFSAKQHVNEVPFLFCFQTLCCFWMKRHYCADQQISLLNQRPGISLSFWKISNVKLVIQYYLDVFVMQQSQRCITQTSP